MLEKDKEKRLPGETAATSSSDDIITRNVETLRREIEATAGVVDATVEVVEPHLIGGGARVGADNLGTGNQSILDLASLKPGPLDPLKSDTGVIIFKDRQNKINRKKAA